MKRPQAVALAATLLLAAVQLDAHAAPQPRRSTGERTWAVLLCNFPDHPIPHEPQWYADLFGPVYPGVGYYWKTVSYGTLTVSAVVLGWYTLPHDYDHYAGDPDAGQLKKDELMGDCQRAADGDVDFTDVDGIAAWFNGAFDDYANEGFGGPTTLVVDQPGAIRPGVLMSDPTYWNRLQFADHPEAIVTHEMGHAFGFQHSGNAPDAEYGSDWDLMSNIAPFCDHLSGPCEPVHPIAYWKRVAGWIPDSAVYVPAEDSTTEIRLHPLSGNLPTDEYVIAQIPYRGRSTWFFTLEARTQENYDALLPGEGVLVHLARTSLSDIYIKSQDDGFRGSEGSMIDPGEEFFDDESGVRVGVVGRNEDGSFNVIVTTPPPTSLIYARSISLRIRESSARSIVRAPGSPQECRSGWVVLQKRTELGWRRVARYRSVVGNASSIFHNHPGKDAYRAVALPGRLGWDQCDRAISRTLMR